MAIRFDIKKVFRQAAAVALMGLAGAGAGGYGYHATHGKLDAHKTPASLAAVEKYQTRLNTISAQQDALATTTDEDAASKLEKRKRVFLADVMLDTTISEADVGALAGEFNKLGADDGIVFRFASENPSSLRERNECLADVMLTKDRLETAERTQDCMTAYATKDEEGARTSTKSGALVGIALAGSFLLGRRFGRRKEAQGPQNT
ncbi:MAG: hypothetical protein EPN97_05390 [Alphaproteobacteria bacterium]|nr:MAG: hypothetical protein EPN97_05390 [Alphaproteobacteria bacterium]